MADMGVGIAARCPRGLHYRKSVRSQPDPQARTEVDKLYFAGVSLTCERHDCQPGKLLTIPITCVGCPQPGEVRRPGFEHMRTDRFYRHR